MGCTIFDSAIQFTVHVEAFVSLVNKSIANIMYIKTKQKEYKNINRLTYPHQSHSSSVGIRPLSDSLQGPQFGKS